MKWKAIGMFINEETFLEFSIRSTIDFVDEMILLEGSTPHTYFSSPYGLSTDRSANIVRELQLEYPGKIKFVQVGWVPSKNVLRQMSLNFATRELPPEAILILDLDEVWDPDDLKRADEHFTKDPDLQYLHCDLIQLRGDFQHYRDMSTGEQEHDLYNEQAKKQTIETRNGVKLRQGRTAERLFRWEPGMHYHASHVTICDATGRFPYIDPAYLHRREADMSIKFWHYNYLKPFPHVVSKFCYFAQQDAGLPRNDPKMLDRALSEGYIEYLRTGKHPKGDWAVSPLPSNLVHPEIMKSHPYYSMGEREIVDPAGEWIPTEGEYDRERVMAMLQEASHYVAPSYVKGMTP